MCSAHSSPRPLKAIPETLKSIYSSSELRVGRDRSPWTTEGCATPVEMAVAVVVGFKGDRISHEHIYWDQAGVLVQVGLLDPKGLPVTGAESARKVVNPSLPSVTR